MPPSAGDSSNTIGAPVSAKMREFASTGCLTPLVSDTSSVRGRVSVTPEHGTGIERRSRPLRQRLLDDRKESRVLQRGRPMSDPRQIFSV